MIQYKRALKFSLIIILTLNSCSGTELNSEEEKFIDESKESLDSINLNEKPQTENIQFLDFTIQDTFSVNKIKIYNSLNNDKIILVKQEPNIWVDEKGKCLKSEVANRILEAMFNITIKALIPENDKVKRKEDIKNNHKKIEIYNNGTLTKTWYLGQSTHDNYGNYMFLNKPEFKDSIPVIMGLKGINGTLESVFFENFKEFYCLKG